jgi:hypothetical protein
MTADRDWDQAFAELARAGAHIRLYPDQASALYIHAKAIVADAGRSGLRVLVGSQNPGDFTERTVVLRAGSLQRTSAQPLTFADRPSFERRLLSSISAFALAHLLLPDIHIAILFTTAVYTSEFGGINGARQPYPYP